MKMKWPMLLALFAAFSFVSGLHAARPERVLIDSFEDFAKGEAESTKVVEPGRLEQAAQLSSGPELPGMTIFSGVAVGKGDGVLVGTGPDGKIFRLSGKSKAEQVTQFAEPYVYAMTKGNDGEVFAGTSPGGKIFKLNSKGTFEVYFEPGETYIWDLAVGKDGNLYAATGTKGRIYRITGQGKGEIWYDSDESSIRCLAFDADGNLLAGSSGQGLVYRITGKGKATVLLDSSKEEIVAMAPMADGQIFVAALGGQTSLPSAPKPQPSSSPKLGDARGLVTVEGDTEEPKPARADNDSQKSSSSKESRGGSLLYLIHKNGYPELVWQTEEDIYALRALKNGVKIGTGNKGNLYTMSSDGELSMDGRVDASQVVQFIGNGTGYSAILANDNARLFYAGNSDVTPGIYRSSVIDSKLFAEWGRLQAKGDGAWSIRTRSGNTPDPDKSWNPWTRLGDGKIDSPSSRYLQFEIAVSRGVVDRVEVFYLPQNQAPKIIVLRVLPPGIGYEGIGQPAPPPQPATADQMLKGDLIEKDFPIRYQPVLKPGLRTIAWSAIDPNGDALRYDVAIRQDGTSDWETLGEKLEDPVFSWDTSGWPDGTYFIRVTADDSLDNIEGQGLKVEKISEPWAIDNTPPSITILGQAKDSVRFKVEDKGGSLLTAVASSNDGREFQMLQPEDGILDSSSETFTAKRLPGKPLYIRAEDECGNTSGLRVAPVK